MSAQPGGAIVLAYRSQPAQAQLGGAISLDTVPVATAGGAIRTGCVAPWAASRASGSRTEAPFSVTAPRDASAVAPWAVAAPLQAASSQPWVVASKADEGASAPWGEYASRPTAPAVVPWGVASQADHAAVAPWGSYSGRAAASASPSWRTAYKADDSVIVPWGRYQPAARDVVAVVNPAHPRNPRWNLPWVRYSRILDPGYGVVTPDGTPPTDPAGTVIVPVQEFYFVLNEFTLARADTAEPVEVSDFSASIDTDSWCWGWSATLSADQMDLVRSPTLGEHVELVASINGTPLRLVVERMGRDRRFANATLKISGRGRAAWLADPHSPVGSRYNTEARTAQQLLADALAVNGVSIGWSIDWRITDWLVPAGAWSHTGTYMDAATRISEAGGAYVQAHNTDQTLIVLPRYPAAPWSWGTLTPDIEIPEDVCEVESIEWQDKPDYNAIWVSGGTGGRRDRIRRTGFAADRPAPTIVDELATAPEMTRQRGTAALGDTGRQAHITLRLPVLPETGIIQPGKLVRYAENGNSRIGLSRSVQIEQRFPTLWQSIRLETHE
ncbi:hypothetical protein [Aromatoleum toluclasticum]|uniref:hypothetical protein n=1 Tax=Aromatoleum toluclasticum TaxID=92003 RepID=UPI0003A5E460|nr:hypothetical protein [Aromatoleum toluclasticum]